MMNRTLRSMTVAELCQCEGVTRSALVELVQYEIAHPLAGSSADDW